VRTVSLQNANRLFDTVRFELYTTENASNFLNGTVRVF
jgi:hypothetical protein